MTRNQWRIAALLFFSGLCALIYQTVWLRQFRLIFGASTYATGAVLAIFMAGLGIGSALLGKRADAKDRPLAFYARLELLIAAAAAISPLLLQLVARIYFASGGSPALGTAGATVLRLLLSLIVLAPATVLMGGTLPAAARAAETNEDSGRRGVALLYGVNTLGAVIGALLATFVFLENLGNRVTLLVAVLINVLVAIVARSMSATMESANAATASVEESSTSTAQPRAVYAASAIVGFAFLLMELVWYRMLSPILGGTAYMFGLVLAIALLGIGMGGAAYALLRRGAPTMSAFAITCSLEALAIAFPFALGDRLAIFAGTLRNFGLQVGFAGHVLSWTIVTMVVVFPAAFIAGVQFPLLIGLLGKGRESVGRHIGVAYAWNTAGAIIGSLAGGFGILPLLSTPTTWRMVVVILVLLALGAFALTIADRLRMHAAVTIACAVAAVLCVCTTGPTAAWRHSGIGAGRMPQLSGINELRRWMLDHRRMIVWDRDGRESSVALAAVASYAFVVNGKTDGAARGDAPTQVMLGLIGAILHPNPKTALVVGLGTGSTSGWLAQIPSMERVDTAELEPVILDVARVCAPVNAGAMRNPKVRVQIADAREVLLTSDEKYDVIASEPSNPYRAGVASLYTRNFYEAVADRLNPGGYFAQWTQAYGIHSGTVRTIYATLQEVFPHILTWSTQQGDLVLLASKQPIVVDTDVLRKRIATNPYRAAAFNVWRVTDVEGLLAKVIANEEFARAAARSAEINTDDRTVIEFGFARSLGDEATLIRQIVAEAGQLNASRPTMLRGAVNWQRVQEQSLPSATRPEVVAEILFRKAGDGDANVEPIARRLGLYQPTEGLAILAALREKQQQHDLAADLLRRAFLAQRTNPWADEKVVDGAIDLALKLSRRDVRYARMFRDSLARQFSAATNEAHRKIALTVLSAIAEGCGAGTIASLHDVEPNPFWTRETLHVRAQCYGAIGDPRARDAVEDLERYDAAEPEPLTRPSSAPSP